MRERYKRSAIWHPFTQHGLGLKELEINRAEGALLFSADGREIIDAVSSWWVITHGHCDPDIVRAVQAQAAQLDQIIFAGFTHPTIETLTQKLLRRAGAQHKHAFYSDSGSTAVEVALKMAIGYWHHKGESDRRRKVLALEGGYHGDTFGTMSVGERGVYNAAFSPFLYEVDYVPAPLAEREDEALSRLEVLLKQGAHNYAAFIFEPLLQGAGGMRMYSAQMLQAMCALCRAHGVLLIADEVMTGFGRTGSFFACDQIAAKPDLVALSKGLTGGFLPMGATLATADIYDAFYHDDRAKMFFHSSSFTGNPLAAAAALASIEIWDNRDVMADIARIEAAHDRAAQHLAGLPHICHVRRCGTILAMDLCDPEGAAGYLSNIGQDFYKYALEKGALLRPLGDVIYILPPYCVTDDQLQILYDLIAEF